MFGNTYYTRINPSIFIINWNKFLLCTCNKTQYGKWDLGPDKQAGDHDCRFNNARVYVIIMLYMFALYLEIVLSWADHIIDNFWSHSNDLIYYIWIFVKVTKCLTACAIYLFRLFEYLKSTSRAVRHKMCFPAIFSWLGRL